MVFNADEIVGDSGFIARCCLTGMKVNAPVQTRSIDSIIFYHICTVTIIQPYPLVRKITSSDGIVSNRYGIKIINVNTLVGVGEGVAADLQARRRAAAVVTV